jgi:hypothetical protein
MKPGLSTAIGFARGSDGRIWIPAFAGMTGVVPFWIPAFAGMTHFGFRLAEDSSDR